MPPPQISLFYLCVYARLNLRNRGSWPHITHETLNLQVLPSTTPRGQVEVGPEPVSLPFATSVWS